ncbi:MAG: 6-bladed beta-propeller [Bacteroidota bacterium]
MRLWPHATVLLCCLLSIATVCFSQEKEPPVWPAPPQQARIQFLFSISSKADLGIEKSFLRKAWDWLVGADQQSGFLVKPLGIATDLSGRIYVTDPGAQRVHIFDRKNKRYETLSETEHGQLRSPVAVAIAADGAVYVTDSALREVAVFDEDGDAKFSIKGFFERPTGIVIYMNKLYVVDTALNKVLVFSLDGTFLFEFGERGTQPGEFNFPVFIGAGASLYLADAMNHRVQVLGDSGTAMTVFGEVGNVQGTFANPKGIAVDTEGHIYVADALFNAFQVFDRDGKLLLVVGGPGGRAGEFSMPSGLWIDEENKVYVVDALNRRVQVFQYLSEHR